MEQKAKQTARKATLHTWNVACLQNRTDGSCLPHEPGRTSQSNSRNTIIPLTCEAFRSCFKLIRMHICRYIYIIYMQYAAIWCCCNLYEHSRLPTAPFDSVAVVFVTFWQLCFAAIRIGDCSVAFGRDLVGGIAGPASQRTRVFSPDGDSSNFMLRFFRFFRFFLVGVSPPLRTTRLASLSFSSKPWASFCWIGRRPGMCFFPFEFVVAVSAFGSFGFHFVFHFTFRFLLTFDYVLLHFPTFSHIFSICLFCFHLFLHPKC